MTAVCLMHLSGLILCKIQNLLFHQKKILSCYSLSTKCTPDSDFQIVDGLNARRMTVHWSEPANDLW
jgi:hypothetical protein